MSLSPTTREIEAVLQSPGGERGRFLEALGKLPRDVDPGVAARAALSLIGGDVPGFWIFARTCGQLPAPVIRALMEQLGEDRRPHSFFLRECIPLDASEPELTAAWETALQALLDLDTSHAWNSNQQEAMLQTLAKKPAILHAIQTAAVACEKVPLPMLAVLAADASDTSVDALIPHVERAVTQQDESLDRLQSLRVHARSTPAMDALFARMRALLEARPGYLPALEFARGLGFRELDLFWFQAQLVSRTNREAPGDCYQVRLSVDSRSAAWFKVALSGAVDSVRAPPPFTLFSSDKVHFDKLRVGTCEPAGLPRWLATTGAKLGMPWDFNRMTLQTHLRERERDRLERWLRAEG